MRRLTQYAIASSAICLSACAGSTVPAIATETATEAELCRQWGASLATRSRRDTEQTQAAIQAGYAAFSLACPAWAYLVP